MKNASSAILPAIHRNVADLDISTPGCNTDPLFRKWEQPGEYKKSIIVSALIKEKIDGYTNSLHFLFKT